MDGERERQAQTRERGKEKEKIVKKRGGRVKERKEKGSEID